MNRPATIVVLAIVAFALSGGAAGAVVCRPTVTNPIVVVSPAQRLRAARLAQPPLTGGDTSFLWPDTPLGVIKTPGGYEFFGSDGSEHAEQVWHGASVGNDKSGSIVTTAGTLDDPLGSGPPKDVSVSANPDASLDPFYPTYRYIGGGPVFVVPAGLPGAGNLLATYHAELPNDSLYATLGLAATSDNGLHWNDLGEIVRLNQAYALGLDGFEIGDGPLVLSPDGKYFYLYFPDWIANGTSHATTTTKVSVARALVSSVLSAAFGSEPHHVMPFAKFYEGNWRLQPALGGASSDLDAHAGISGYLDVHYDSEIARYVMIVSDDTTFAYAESVDGLTWTPPLSLGTYGPIAAYPTAVGLGPDPRVLGKRFYVYYTHLGTATLWKNGTLERFTLRCS